MSWIRLIQDKKNTGAYADHCRRTRGRLKPRALKTVKSEYCQMCDDYGHTRVDEYRNCDSRVDEAFPLLRRHCTDGSLSTRQGQFKYQKARRDAIDGERQDERCSSQRNKPTGQFRGCAGHINFGRVDDVESHCNLQLAGPYHADIMGETR